MALLGFGPAAFGQVTGTAEALRAGTGGAASQAAPGQGGGTQADFDSLIDLITKTIRPSTWDIAGGTGSVAPFPTGVMADPHAALKIDPEATGQAADGPSQRRAALESLVKTTLAQEGGSYLAALRRFSGPRPAASDARVRSPLRKVSLPRLELQVQKRLEQGLALDDEIQCLAGLERIHYVFVYPESGDLVLAGPAGDWKRQAKRLVSAETEAPLVRLDDLVVMLRQIHAAPGVRFGCAITPRKESLAKVQEYLDQTGKRPLAPGQRRKWVDGLRDSVGPQDVSVYGLDARTRAAHVMVEADYHMKQIGMGLAEGVPGVESYLDLVRVPAGQAPPPMTVLRWWFTMHYDPMGATADHRAFALRGTGVKVLSENELLAADGERVHTGQSEELNRKFAQSFTDHFPELCRKYPIYAELRQVFDLALVAALIGQEGLDMDVGWQAPFFRDPEGFGVELTAPQETVQSVVNHRVVNRVHVLAGVSGGVSVNPKPLLARKSMAVEGLERPAQAVPDRAPPADPWWWD